MIGLYIYLSGSFIITAFFVYNFLIKGEPLLKKHLLPMIGSILVSWFSIIFLIGIILDEYMEEHGDEKLFNKKDGL
jgi:hypothetical protein